VKHFEDFVEDQFDFHSYCLRKVTLRAYVSVLRFEDHVHGQQFFCQAAAGIIRIYLMLFDNPSNNESEGTDYSKMTAADRKKAKAIARTTTAPPPPTRAIPCRLDQSWRGRS
jgi:N-alpha-acetyltransferase 15/16, NatA auxiliary subunit